MIKFNNVSVEFPIFNASQRSLKNAVLNAATGGQLGTDKAGHTLVKALNNISFEMLDGERVGLIGHNGAGKTTLLRLLSGAYHPTSGITSSQGEIGSLIDISLGIDPEATGIENIYIRSRLLGLTKKETDDKLGDIIEFSELGEFIDMPIRTYSSGMHLRLAFAVATMIRPDILIMDEWLSVGDESFQEKAEARLNELISSTKILVIASHSRELLHRTCNRVIWLEHGQIKMDADTETVLNSYFG